MDALDNYRVIADLLGTRFDRPCARMARSSFVHRGRDSLDPEDFEENLLKG